MKIIRGRGAVTKNGRFIFPKDGYLTKDELNGFIDYNYNHLLPKYRENMKMYLGEHDILDKDPIDFGPDNRLVVNKAKQIVDTFNGYFIGIPPSISLEKGSNNDELQVWLNHVSFMDKLNELSKQTDIYGKSIGFVYQNETAETRFNYVSPTKAFIIYDDTIEHNPLAFVRYEFYDNQSQWQARGKIYYSDSIYDFDKESIDYNAKPNPYKLVPAIEFYENEERQGIFDQVKTLINALDNAYSQKANQLDYFDIAYLVMMGIRLPEDKKTGQPSIDIVKNRLLYLPDITPGTNPKVEFLSKPSDDGMQENFIKHLTDEIYNISMIQNLNDEKFAGNASGIALKYKMLLMQDKAKSKQRKFIQSLRNLFRIIFSVGQVIPESAHNAWEDLQINFTLNVPDDVASMISAAKDAEGLVSKRTQLKLLPGIVDDPDDEIKQMEKEKQDSIKDAQQAAGSLPDYMKQSDSDDQK